MTLYTVPVHGERGIMSNVPRTSVLGGSITSTTGQIRLGYFRASRSGAFSAIRAITGTTAAAATPTTCLMGLYSVAANGDLTLVAVTANDTTLFATIGASYQKSFVAPAVVAQGQLYAMAEIVVSGAATPTWGGLVMYSASEAGQDDRVSAVVTGQTTLPATIAVGSVTASTFVVYMALVP